jgi:HK97 family phage portal protein
LRNNRFEISELHLMDPRGSVPQVADNGEVFYALTGNQVIEQRFDYPLLVPARDVLHIKLQSARYNPLVGESPLMAAAGDIAMSGAITAQQMQFYMNQARPGIILSTDLPLKKDVVDELRAMWNRQTTGANAGGTPILSNGLKPILVQTTAKDAEVADVFRMTQQNIALAFRIPLQILGIGTSAAGGSTATLMQDWVSSSLGFALNHVEEAFGKTFGLYGQPDEYVELSTAALLRSNSKERIESQARGVISGIYSPNEARAQLELPEVEFGDEPRVQQQVVPLSAAEGIPSAPGPGAAPPAPAALPAPADNQPAAKVLEFPDDSARIRRRFQASHARHIV